jgi:hypothetical protein
MTEGEDDDDDDDEEIRRLRARTTSARGGGLQQHQKKKEDKSWKVLEGRERAGQARAAKRGPGRTTRKVLEAAHRFP